MCDWLAGEVLAFDADGHREVVARVEGLPFSIDWLPDGRLVARRRAGWWPAPTWRRTARPVSRSTRSSSTRQAGRGSTCRARCPGSRPSRASWPSCSPTGSSHQVADDVWFPNGMAILGDDTLVVAESHADRLTAWTITDAGELVDRRVWADLGPGSAPDGICADADGAIWYASVPGQRCTRVAEGGEMLETIEADRGCFSCMLGGDDGRTLFIVANRWGGGAAIGRRRPHPTRRRAPRRPTLSSSSGCSRSGGSLRTRPLAATW